MGLNLEYLPGQTPLDEEEIEGLLIPVIATRGELDEFEQHNIEQAIEWTLKRSFKPQQIFTEAFVREAIPLRTASAADRLQQILVFQPPPPSAFHFLQISLLMQVCKR